MVFFITLAALVRFSIDRKTRKILGVQIVGPGKVDKRIDTMVAALTFGATVDDLANMDLSYAPPLSSRSARRRVIINFLPGIKCVMSGPGTIQVTVS